MNYIVSDDIVSTRVFSIKIVLPLSSVNTDTRKHIMMQVTPFNGIVTTKYHYRFPSHRFYFDLSNGYVLVFFRKSYCFGSCGFINILLGFKSTFKYGGFTWVAFYSNWIILGSALTR